MKLVDWRWTRLRAVIDADNGPENGNDTLVDTVGFVRRDAAVSVAVVATAVAQSRIKFIITCCKM